MKCLRCGQNKIMKSGRSVAIKDVTYYLCGCGNVMMEQGNVLTNTPEDHSMLTQLLIQDASKSLGLPAPFVSLDKRTLELEMQPAETIDMIKSFISSLAEHDNDGDEDYEDDYYEDEYDEDEYDDDDYYDEEEDEEDDHDECLKKAEENLAKAMFEKNFKMLLNDLNLSHRYDEIIDDELLAEITDHIRNAKSIQEIISLAALTTEKVKARIQVIQQEKKNYIIKKKKNNEMVMLMNQTEEEIKKYLNVISLYTEYEIYELKDVNL